ILLQRSPSDSGLWPLMGTRVSSVLLLAILVAVQRLALRPAAAAGWWLAGLGAGIALADLLFLLATRSGMLSLVAVVTSLYPAVTVTLAALLLHERITRTQLAGLVAAGVSVALIASG
ncbi:MAG TPA: EamA family transporter, partial [Candidatus Limnocylindrales bacterium]